MSMIDLTALRCSGADISLMDYAALQEPSQGGVVGRVGRLGSRFSMAYQAPAMPIEAEGRRWIARLQRAQREGAYILVPQVDFAIGSTGAPTVNGAHTGGTALAITGATAAYVIREGQALNLTVSGRRYLYFAADIAVLDENGAGSVTLTTPMRTHLSGGEAVELARPVLEGWLDGTERSWTLDIARTVGLSFTISERA